MGVFMSEKPNNTRLTPVNVGLIVFAIILMGAFAGWAANEYLPSHQLTEATRSLVTVSMAIVATISALVLGLLISNANASFVTHASEVTALSADILRLEQMLRRYGPEADTARQALRQYAEHKTADLFPEDARDVDLCNPTTYELLLQLEDSLLALEPANSRNQWRLEQAMTLAGKIGDIRWLLAQQSTARTPKAFIGLLTFWLTSLFASFGLFAPHNFVSALALALCALAVSGAIGMILELEQTFGGIIRVSPLPMHSALAILGDSTARSDFPKTLAHVSPAPHRS
jgi:hypothetical protein